jgi:hypothetical protein
VKVTKKRVLVGALILLVASFVVQKLISKDERQVRRAIEAVATSADPRYCDQRMTERYLEHTTGEERPFADEICESQASVQPADSLDTDEISVDGNRATALVTYSGGPLDGSTVELQLVKVDDEWKLDRVLSIPHLDREKRRVAWRESLLELGYSQRAVDCALQRERRLPDVGVEQLILENGGAVLTQIAIECDRDDVERDLAYGAANPELDVSPGGLACVRRRIESATDSELSGLRLSLLAWGRLIVSCDPDVFRDYVKRGLEADGELDRREELDCAVVLREESRDGVIRLSYDEDRLAALIKGCRLPPHTFRTS